MCKASAAWLMFFALCIYILGEILKSQPFSCGTFKSLKTAKSRTKKKKTAYVRRVKNRVKICLQKNTASSPDLFIPIQIKFKTAGKWKYHTSKKRRLQQHAPLKERGAASFSAQTEVFAQWELKWKRFRKIYFNVGYLATSSQYVHTCSKNKHITCLSWHQEQRRIKVWKRSPSQDQSVCRAGVKTTSCWWHSRDKTQESIKTAAEDVDTWRLEYVRVIPLMRHRGHRVGVCVSVFCLLTQ